MEYIESTLSYGYIGYNSYTCYNILIVHLNITSKGKKVYRKYETLEYQCSHFFSFTSYI